MKTPRLLRWLLTTVVTSASCTAWAAPDPNFHIYLLLGQSNMQGTADIQAQDRIRDPRVMTLQSENGCNGQNWTYGQWREAFPPQVRCNQEGGLGPGDTFGHTMAANMPENVKIGLVGGAYGGAQIESFLPNCSQYASNNGKPNACYPPYGDVNGAPKGSNGATSMYNWVLELAKKAQEAGVIKGIIFHQGESNASSPNGWTGKVNQYVTALRNDLGLSADELPFIAGELPYTGCCSSFNTYVRQIPSAVANGHYVTADGGLNDKGDGLHWDSAAVREMGRRYAAKMLEVANLDSTPIDCGTTSEGNPRCCDISADPDGDGWGTQNTDQMCQVDNQTPGWNPPEIAMAINVGGDAASFDGVSFRADDYFTGGMTNATSDPVQGAGGSSVPQSERYGESFSYEIPLDNGYYEVQLSFVELYQTAANRRSFNVSVEGSNLFADDIDLFATVGHDTLYQPPVKAINLADGALSITVTREAGNANADNGTLSAILVKHAEAPASSSAPSSAAASSSSQVSSTAPVSSSSAPASSSATVQSSSAAAQSSEAASSSSAASEPIKLGSIDWRWALALLMLGAARVGRRKTLNAR